MPQVRRADARSRDTEFSGLPKSCLVQRNAVQALGAGAYTQIQFDAIAHNYGPFLPTLGAGANVVVTEPGVYTIHAVVSSAGPGAQCYLLVNRNGAGILNTGGAGSAFQTMVPGSIGIELKASDSIALLEFSTGAVNTVANTTFLYIQKQGGQY
jgi:hypothetical protein